MGAVDPYRLDSKVALITGGTRGIGAQVVRLCVARGARVVFSSRKPEECARMTDELALTKQDVRGVVAHAADDSDCERLVRTTLDSFGRLDLVIANAGVNPVSDPLETLSFAAWARVMETNLAGPWRLARHALPTMAGSGGSMVVVSSINARLGFPGASAYGVSKAGLEQLVRQLAVEWGGRGVRINGVAPGTIRTDMIRALLKAPRWAEDVVARTPLARLGEPEDVAAAIIFLGSDAARHMTGQILTVDGGETIKRG